MPRASVLAGLVRQWGPQAVICDRFRLAELQDVGTGLRLVPRVCRWSSASEDIRALRATVATWAEAHGYRAAADPFSFDRQPHAEARAYYVIRPG